MSARAPRSQAGHAARPPVWSTTTGSAGAAHVVLVHGSLDRSAGLLKLGRRLAERCRTSRYDRRGYGRSRPCPGPYGMDAQVADLIEVIEAAGGSGRPRVVFGHSYGGNVALALADRRPDLVDGVVVYESPLSWLDWWPDSTPGGIAAAWRDAPEDAAEGFMRRLIGDHRWERLPPATRRARRAEGPAMVGELVDLRRGPPWQPSRITVPVLAVSGEHGAAHHRAAMEHLAAVLPDAELASIPGAKHFGPNTHPDVTAGLVFDLVDRRARSRPAGPR